jgi:hypothetical protein
MKLTLNHWLSAIAVVLFIFLAILSLGGTSDTSDTTQLNASVIFTGTQFKIKNNDNFDYINVSLEVNGDYTLKGYNLNAGETYTVGIMQFSDDDGNRFNMMKKPQKFTIWCDLSTGGNGMYIATWK